MRKLTAWILGFCLACMPLVAQAAETQAEGLILTGYVEARGQTTILAPFGGTVKDFSLREGDRVLRGTQLMTLDTAKVYAPCAGTVRGVFAQAGDSLSYVQNRYGALCYIEPENEFIIQTALSTGYSSEDNRVVHVGEKVYLRGANDTDLEGTGRITQVATGDVYTVEVTEAGDFALRDAVNIYRDEEYEADTRIGRGTILRTEPVAVMGDTTASILSVTAREGAEVKRGAVLFDTVSGQLDGLRGASGTISAPSDGVVAKLGVTAGQNVAKNQPLVTLYKMDVLQVVTSISEQDMGKISKGDTVHIRLDGVEGKEYEGTVAAIAGMSSRTDHYAEYAVYVDFAPDEQVALGMNATVYTEAK